MKTCTKCGIPKENQEFYKRSESPDGFDWWCKTCKHNHVKNYYHHAIESQRVRGRSLKTKALRKKRWRENPTQHLLWSARRRAKIKKLPFALTVNDIVIPDMCPILGIKLEIGNDKATDNSPTIDRKYQELGYIKDNIHVISYRANRLKNDASFEEIEALYKWTKGIAR